MSPTDSPQRLVLLDSHGILYRAYFAFGSRGDNLLRTSKGELTFAVFGFAETLLRVLDELKPTHIAAAWDGPARTFRHDADETYKANRRETPDDFKPQAERTRELLDAFNIPIIEAAGYEADDVLGTLAKRAVEQGIETYIATLDTDLIQLVEPNLKIFMFRPYQRDTVIYDDAAVVERWGFDAPRMVDFKALKGDTSDNVPGVAGIGEKTAIDLIQRFGTVEAIYEHLDELKPAQRKRLEEGRDAAIHSKHMVGIVTDLPLELDLEACHLHTFDQARVVELFRELEFRRLLERFLEVAGQPLAAPPPDETKRHYAEVTSEEDLASLAEALQAAGAASVAALTSAGDERGGLILGLAFATEPGRAWYVPVGHAPRLDDDNDQLPISRVREVLGPLLASPYLRKLAFSTKETRHRLSAAQMPGDGFDFDVSLAAFLLGDTGATLNSLAGERMGAELTTLQSIKGSGRSAVTLAEADRSRVATYACEQADYALRLRAVLEPQVEERGQLPLLNDMELPLVEVLFAMEQAGIAIDLSVLSEISAAMTGEIEAHERDIFAMVGHEFNIGSPKQLSDILFNELGLPKTRKTQSGYSTDQRALEGLREVSPIIDRIFEYRELTKLKSTYTDALPMTLGQDGRIHTDYQQNIAATGRLSSTNPNLQNIPVRTEIGRQIRRAFVATGYDDAWFTAADYSQIELRILAHISGDQGLIDAFLDDQDIHQATAAAVYGVEPEHVTREMRDTAKMVNFGIAYGMGEFGLASRTGMSRQDAAAFIASYYTRFPGIRDWQETTLAFTRERGYAESLFGRRRYLPEINARNFQVRAAAEREAINMPIQGTAADIIKVAMIRVQQEMKASELQSRMLLQVHDELIFEGPADEVEALKELSCRIMPASIEICVPLKVDVKKGRNWGEMEPI